MSTRVHARMSRASVREMLLLGCMFAALNIDSVCAQSQDDRSGTNEVSGDAVSDGASSSADHSAPPPPQQPMEPMSGQRMTDVMEMDDSAIVTLLSVDRLERFDGDDGVATSWKASASIGNDFDKLRLRTEGEYTHGAFDRSDAEAFWGHAISAFWDAQLGVRHDVGRGDDRNWMALGVEGLAPYGFEIEATAYASGAGRTALRFEVDYDALLTQRLIVQPRLEINAYGRGEPAARVGSGLSDAEFGVRLRYEIRREFAPYVGVERAKRFGESASLLGADGLDAAETRWVLGVRVWY